MQLTARCLLDASRQQLFRLVLDAPLISSPLACSRYSAGKSHVTSPVSWPVLKEEVPVIDGFLRKEKVCTSTKADGLAGTDQKIFKTEEDHNFYSSSAEVDGKDSEGGSQESPDCTKSHEKPSTSVVKVVKKGEMLNFCFFVLFSSPSPWWWLAICDRVPSVGGIISFLCIVLICVGTFRCFPFN